MIRSLPLSEWPVADQTAWKAACVLHHRLQRGGRAASLSPVMQRDHARRYGYLLAFLKRQGQLDNNAPAAQHVTPEVVESFLASCDTWSTVTVSIFVGRLRRLVEALAPQQDWTWLRELESDTKSDARPQARFHRLVATDQLVETGLSLMKQADLSTTMSPRKRACLARNGLMVALLALCPIRLKNFTALELGSTFRFLDGQWWIFLSGSETKTRRPDQRIVPDLLRKAIEHYICTYRPILLGLPPEDRPSSQPIAEMIGPLWVGATGQKLGYSAVGPAINETTLTTLGVAVNPHAFRAAAAWTAAYRGASHPDLASALLQHHDRRTTDQHYNRASSLQAGLDYAQLLRTGPKARNRVAVALSDARTISRDLRISGHAISNSKLALND